MIISSMFDAEEDTATAANWTVLILLSCVYSLAYAELTLCVQTTKMWMMVSRKLPHFTFLTLCFKINKKTSEAAKILQTNVSLCAPKLWIVTELLIWAEYVTGMVLYESQ